MKIHVHKGDLPDGIQWGNTLAVDTEAAGLNIHRDRLCVVQLTDGGGDVHLVQIAPGQKQAKRLTHLLQNPDQLKLFHFGRFDIALLYVTFGVLTRPVYCTKIASWLCRTYTSYHGLKDLCHEFLGVQLSKQQQCSDWGREKLSEEQAKYAAEDVIHLHKLWHALDDRLKREGRLELVRACHEFLPNRALLDVEGWEDFDIFAHSARA
jgi:ribonuclease D